MRRTTGLLLGAALLILASVVLGTPAVAQQPQQTYTLDWWTVDGGGATFTGGNGYTLNGTVGQPDAGVLSGGDGYTLGGGFWKGGALSTGYDIYLPLVVRGG